jgi:hypothetical protein
MALQQLEVHEIVNQAVSKGLDIPEFQREFVWGTEQVKFFAESLYRDYPVGALLLWDSSEYQEAKTAQSTQASSWIVDGQQRTTALCLLLGMKPYWWPHSHEWNESLERYDVLVNVFPETKTERLHFSLPNPIRMRDYRWISLRRILSLNRIDDLSQVSKEIVSKIEADPDKKMDLFADINSRLQSLWQIRKRLIPVIKIHHEIEDVAEIFARLNQYGTRVKEADVILALAAVLNPGWVRQEYIPFSEDLDNKGWNLDAGIYIRTMTGIGYGRARLIEVPHHFWDKDSLPNVWKETTIAIHECLKRFEEFGILSSELLPSKNSLIPLFVLTNRWRDSESYNFKKSLKWFLLANWDGRYSGSSITSLNEDVRSIKEAPDFNTAVRNLQAKLRISSNLAPEDFLGRYEGKGNSFLRLILYMTIFHGAARDWCDPIRIGYDKTDGAVLAGFEPQWHHIFPKNMLEKAKADNKIDKEANINSLANITILNERTNAKKIGGKDPSNYIIKYKISSDDLRSHLIPDSFIRAANTSEDVLKWHWSVERYPDFIKERANLLSIAVNSFIDGLDK